MLKIGAFLLLLTLKPKVETDKQETTHNIVKPIILIGKLIVHASYCLESNHGLSSTLRLCPTHAIQLIVTQYLPELSIIHNLGDILAYILCIQLLGTP